MNPDGKNKAANELEKHYISAATWYSLKYPRTWEVEEDEGYSTFFEPESGVGAFQVSAYETPSPQDCEAILLEYLADHGIQSSQCERTVETQNGKCIAACRYTENAWFRRVWFISEDNRLLMLTYNCKTEHRGKEDRQIESIIESVTINPETN